MNIAIIGLGGVGAYFGFKMTQAKGEHHVSFIARGKTLEKVQRDGLTLISPDHPKNNVVFADEVLEQISDLKTPDLVIIAVKDYDLQSVCEQLSSVVSEETIFLPMMNGVDIYDRLKATFPRNTVLPACVYITSHIQSKGVVEHKGLPGKLVFGRDPQKVDRDLIWLINLLDKSGMVYRLVDNPFLGIWKKFILVASLALVSAKYNSSMGIAVSDAQQKAESTAIMQEIKDVALAKGLDLGDDIIEKVVHITLKYPKEAPTSFQLDFNSGKAYNELELFGGAIIKYGKILNVPTPMTSKIYQELKQIEAQRG